MQSKLWRRLWHLVGGSLFPILALFIPKTALLISLGAATGVFVTWEIVRFNVPKVNEWMISHLKIVLKDEERFQATGTTCLLLASVVVFVLFDKYVAITSLFFLSIGDLNAAVIGEEYGRQVLFSNKTLEGSLACLVSCLLIGMLMVGISPTMGLPVAVSGRSQQR